MAAQQGVAGDVHSPLGSSPTLTCNGSTPPWTCSLCLGSPSYRAGSPSKPWRVACHHRGRRDGPPAPRPTRGQRLALPARGHDRPRRPRLSASRPTTRKRMGHASRAMATNHDHLRSTSPGLGNQSRALGAPISTAGKGRRAAHTAPRHIGRRRGRRPGAASTPHALGRWLEPRGNPGRPDECEVESLHLVSLMIAHNPCP